MICVFTCKLWHAYNDVRCSPSLLLSSCSVPAPVLPSSSQYSPECEGGQTQTEWLVPTLMHVPPFWQSVLLAVHGGNTACTRKKELWRIKMSTLLSSFELSGITSQLMLQWNPSHMDTIGSLKKWSCAHYKGRLHSKNTRVVFMELAMLTQIKARGCTLAASHFKVTCWPLG